MIGKPKRTSSIKHSILKPNAQINSLRRCFSRPHPRCGYELAQSSNMSVRRYKKNIESLQQTLQDCQWRHDEKSPIVHCLYVELLAPNLTSKSIAVEIYVEDIEVSLAKMKKILIPEAIYLIIQAIKGFRALWERFKFVSVDEETFGLDCRGNCLTWINSSFEKNQCEDFKLSTPHEIVREIILQVKSKSEPVCEALLQKVLDNLSRREVDFYESQHIISVFAKNHEIKIPENLKYLVHQDRLDKNADAFHTRGSLYESKDYLQVLKTPRFVPSRTSLQEQNLRHPKKEKKENKEGSMCNLMSTLRMTIGPDIRFLTCRSINHNQSVDLSMKEDDVSLTQFQTRKKFNDSAANKDHSCSSHHSRCKSQSYENIKGVQVQKPKKETQTTQSIDHQKPVKRFSGVDHIRTGGSYIDKFKKSNTSLAEVQTAKKLIHHKSSNQMGSSKLMDSMAQCEDKDFIMSEDEPTKQKIPINIISPLQSSDPTFHVIPEAEDVIRANEWTTTIRNLLQTQSKMNTSITQGQDTCSYLQDVRLEKLDTISRQMVASLIPEGSQKMLASDELIQ